MELNNVNEKSTNSEKFQSLVKLIGGMIKGSTKKAGYCLKRIYRHICVGTEFETA